MNINMPSEFEVAVIRQLGEISRELMSLKTEMKVLRASILAVSHKTSLLVADKTRGSTKVAGRRNV